MSAALDRLKKGTLEWYRLAYKEMVFDRGMEASILQAAKRLLKGKPGYVITQNETGVPWWLVGAFHHMESNCDPLAYLGNGQRIIGTGRKSTIVPIGRGPFKTFQAGAIDALKLKGLHKVKSWEIGNTLKIGEQYNGTGVLKYHPRENTAYLWARTSINDGTGKYVKDGKWSESANADGQVGLAAVLKQLEIMGEIQIEKGQNLVDVRNFVGRGFSNRRYKVAKKRLNSEMVKAGARGMRKLTVYKNSKKAKGYSMSIGAYNTWKGDLHFILKPVNGGRTRVYESQKAAVADGWYKVGRFDFATISNDGMMNGEGDAAEPGSGEPDASAAEGNTAKNPGYPDPKI